MSQSLTELANLYATDKGTIGPSTEWGAHNYTDIYEGYLYRYRQSPIHFLEIGLGVTGDQWESHIVHGRNTGGASLRMWYDYFHNAKIFGMDVNPCSYLDNDRIKTFVADQGKIEDLDAFVEATGGIEFDVIVDDGSHRPDHQQVSFSYFFKHLKSGGLYFIEDLASNGLGDGGNDRIDCDNIRNTRTVLKHYLQHGNFAEPNALIDQAYLSEHIDYIGFHVPPRKIKYVFKPSIRRLLKKVVYYKIDQEGLCVIRKR
jgi:hypothetical protein